MRMVTALGLAIIVRPPISQAGADGFGLFDALVTIGSEYQEQPRLVETGSTTPLMALATFPDDPSMGWDLHWEQESWLMGVGLNMTPVRHLSVSGLILGGQARGRFHAYNEGLNTLEEWETAWDEAWGWEAGLELHQQADGGLYLSGTWRRLDGEAGEDEEYLAGPYKPGGEEPNSDVSFDWTDETLSTAAGWRFNSWAPEIGVRHRSMNLHKTIVAHYPEGESWIGDLLNTAAAHYWYENRDVWIPFVGLHVLFGQSVVLSSEFECTSAETFSAQLQLIF